MSFRIELEQARTLSATEPDERLLLVRGMVDRLARDLGAATWGKREFYIDFIKPDDRVTNSRDNSVYPWNLATWEITKTKSLPKSILNVIKNTALTIFYETLSTTYRRQFYRLSLLARNDGSMFFRSNIGETEGSSEQDLKELLTRQFIQGPETKYYTHENRADIRDLDFLG